MRYLELRWLARLSFVVCKNIFKPSPQFEALFALAELPSAVYRYDASFSRSIEVERFSRIAIEYSELVDILDI